ncbi:MAG: sigma-54-dependent Fis family transcriptional regulator [Myxococcales bacterium]|nr:sigma-54-dependent Fis family transcriptional regulator [Myxococcales bacterium]
MPWNATAEIAEQLHVDKDETAIPGAPILLIVDDDISNLESLKRVFERENLSVLTATDGREALEVIRRRRVNVILTDLMMPGMTGTDLLRSVRTIAPEAEVILMTAFGTVETAVEAMKDGAYDFVTKPFKRIQIVKCVKRALEKQALLIENRDLRARLETMMRPQDIIGSSLPMRQMLDMVAHVAPSTATVLLQGESGTGKELVARAVHRLSPRVDKPFVAINCAAIPENILESELFGYERGAFTGAVNRKEGRFKLADGGTLFLDEIGEISPAVQVKLLRVLQEGEFERLGGTATVSVDVRIVAATNRDLAEEVRRGNFREDLFYRLNVIMISLPPLRTRRDDIPLLAHHFLQVYREKNRKDVRGIQRDALDTMCAYQWPGNVRELENTLERAVVLCKGDTIRKEDLPPTVTDVGAAKSRYITVALGTPLEEVEKRLIHETLQMTGGDKRLTAQLLGIATRTIYRKID